MPRCAENSIPAGPPDGALIYERVCQACHGVRGAGVTGLAGPLTGSALVASMTDAELAEFIEVGLAADDPQ